MYDELPEQEAMNGWPSLIDPSKLLSVEMLLLGPPLHESTVLKTINENAGMIVTHEKLAQWLHKFQSPGYSFRDDVTVKLLVQSGREGELARLFLRLRAAGGMKSRAEAMQQALLDEYPKAFSQVSESWLGSELNPEEAFHMMPTSMKRIDLGAVGEKPDELDVLRMILYWLGYVDKYRSLGLDFSDYKVAKVLMSTRNTDEVLGIFLKLRSVHGMEDRADRILSGAILRLAFGDALVKELSPAIVFTKMSISVTISSV
uniref:RXLR phytopathogen effector protein WY-domain domain-containing protein n=1 Tax=Peronospora matthiolae TaxID=2874970 RepID=A0AAV1UPV4_9STRA